ncbi:MAG: diguanylate cyclase [Burkholderiales bacterium]
MPHAISDLFSRQGFLPHGDCLAWAPDLLRALVISDLLIALSYYSIPVALLYFVRRHRDLSFNWIFVLISAFIIANGTTHLLAVLNVWQPFYRLDAAFRVLTAVLSVVTAILLWPLLPRALALPSRARLEESFRALEQQVAERKRTEETLRASEERYRQLSELLEGLIQQRTGELEKMNGDLQREVEERARVQSELQNANSRMADSLGLLEQRRQELTHLSQMSSLLQTSRSAAEACAIAERFAQGLFPKSTGAFYLMDPAGALAETSAQWGELPAAEQVMNADDCWALRRGKPHPESGLRVTPPCRHGERDLPRHVCVPLLAGGERLGVLQLRGAVDLDDDHVRVLLETMAERVALSLANIRLREHLVAQSIRDPLTGLFNRRYLEETLLMEERRARRARTPFGVVMFDLDHFKALNDRHGHEAGDAALRAFAGVLQAQSRAGDVACRYGGEEFTLVLPGASLEVTQARAERIRAGLAANNLSHAGMAMGTLTVSAGVAAYPDHGDTGEVLLRMADEALYRAKHKGRDRVETATAGG